MMGIWIRKYSKRLFHQPLFLVLLVLMPMGTMIFSWLSHQESTTVPVGICCESESGMTHGILENLQEHRGIFSFVRCPSQKEMKKQLAEGELQCGYYFPSDMEERMKNREYDGVITQYYRKGVMIRALAAETVFAAIFERYGESMAETYIMNSGFYDTTQVDEMKISETYQRNQERQMNFQFAYEEAESKRNLGDYLTSPLMGGVALLIFLAGFCGLAAWQEDRRRGLVAAAPAGVRPYLPVTAIGVPVIWTTLSGVLSLMACRFSLLSWKDIVCLLIYGIMVVAFIHMFAYLPVSSGMMWGISLLLVFISTIVTPVFVNLAAVVPGLGTLSWFCPPAYFLNAVYGGGWQLAVMAGAALLLFVVMVWRQRRMK